MAQEPCPRCHRERDIYPACTECATPEELLKRLSGLQKALEKALARDGGGA
jgi:primosomal protein N'